MGNGVVKFVGRKMGDEISLEGKDPDAGDFLKWIFSEIKQDTLSRGKRSARRMESSGCSRIGCSFAGERDFLLNIHG